MKNYYNAGNGTLSKPVINKALNRLAGLLKEKNQRVELVAAGGVISVLLFGSRQMTRDIDVVMAPKDKALLTDLIAQVAQEQNLPSGDHAWLNDGVSFFGLKTKSSNRVFYHPNLVVYSASWYELLGMKLSGAWRRDADFDDAIHILKAIDNKNKDEILKESIKYKNFSPHIADETYTKRFNRTWKDAFGE